MPDIHPYSIDIAEDALLDLKRRLAATRWPERECVGDWTQGVPLSYARELVQYWSHGYDWRRAEQALNSFDQYMTEIQGLDIHFIHQQSPHENAFPLIITHGWPGSICEFMKVIGPLTDPTAHGGKAEDAFHVICPSIPGYGFSGKPSEHGWGVEKIAVVWDELMGRLGYERYGAQGGDWGSAITTRIGMNGGRCAAIHTNMPLGRPTRDAEADPTEEEVAAAKAMDHYREWDSGYSKQQSTRPQTLGYSLVDSPVGQMAWIVEKFWAWTDCEGHPENAVSRDEMLDNVMMYWLTGAGASSGRLYWESFGRAGARTRVEVPTGVASFPKEILPAPRRWCESGYNITHWTTMPRGGHFAALEQPELFTEDVRTFFATIR